MPFISVELARDAILSHFNAAWAAQVPPVPKLLFQDKKDELPLGTESWARITVLHNEGRRVTVGGDPGNRRFRRFGVINIQIFTPFGDGLVTNDKLVQVAVDAFEGKTTGGGDTVEFRNVRSNEIGPDGDWYNTNVVVNFEYDSVK